MPCGRKPTCGSQGGTAGPTTGTVLGDISAAIGAIGGAATVAGLFGKTAVIVIGGVSAAAVVWLAAVAGAAIAAFVVIDFYRLRCLSHPDTERPVCTAGVIQTLVPAFNSATDEIFPFTAMHDRVDVVVKCDYWFRIEQLAAFIFCNIDLPLIPTAGDLTGSPILRGYYKNDKVCGAGLGASIGAVAGGVAGIFLGALVGGAIASAACGPFAWLCLILAVLVALIIAAVCALAGALAGGQIGKAAASSSAPSADDGSALHQGDYVTSTGGILTSGDDQGARVYWFVDNTILHGRSTETPPFNHNDPETNLTVDGCPAPPIG